MPEWVQVLQALSVPTIAAVGALLAWQQVKIARTKLRHDLFDRRFKVFEAARDFLAKVTSEGGVTNEDLREYTVAVLDAQFLFNKEMRDYLFEIRRRVIGIWASRDEWDATMEERRAWLVAHSTVYRASFSRSLS